MNENNKKKSPFDMWRERRRRLSLYVMKVYTGECVPYRRYSAPHAYARALLRSMLPWAAAEFPVNAATAEAGEIFDGHPRTCGEYAE